VDDARTVKPGPEWELIGVPYTSMREPGGIADAIGVLRERGLGERLSALGVRDGGDLELDGPDAKRGPSGLLNEAALITLVERTLERVTETLGRARRPLLVGGDCPVLLGAVAAIRDRDGPAGLVMLDGHEDAWPPDRSDTGEASDSEVAIALDRVRDLPAPIDDLMPLFAPDGLLMVGPRDHAEIAAAGVGSVRDEVALFVDGDSARTQAAAAEAALAEGLTRTAAAGLWLHIDLDVLSTEAFAAVDYPQAGGLGWDALDSLAQHALADERCRGVSVVIYNPALDPDGSEADKVVGFASRLVAAAAGSPNE
jgi:arginase